MSAIPSDDIPEALFKHLQQYKGEQGKERFIRAVYDTLRRMAHRELQRYRVGATLNTTALVHETYLKLFDRQPLTLQNQAHFFALCAMAMRQILVDYARRSRSQKRGGDQVPLSLENVKEPMIHLESRDISVLDLDAALTRLAAVKPHLSQVVELRFFGGLSVEETARVMEIHPRTVKKKWHKARLLLHRLLYDEDAV